MKTRPTDISAFDIHFINLKFVRADGIFEILLIGHKSKPCFTIINETNDLVMQKCN